MYAFNGNKVKDRKIKQCTPETVDEAKADAATAVVFEDIKSTMGVALVNLIWRRMAVVPSVLHWSWQTLKPHYHSGAIPAAAWLFREEVTLPDIEAINNTERGRLTHELKDVAVIEEVLRTYERGNAQNLIALCFLQMVLQSSSDSTGNPAFNGGLSNTTHLDRGQSADQQADSLFGDIPILPALEQLSEDAQALVARSSLLWVPAKYEGLAPSLFRHLTYWPDLLLLFTNRLDAIESDATRRIAPLVSQALETAKFHASGLCEADNSLNELNCKDRKWLQEVLTVFMDVMLARGVIIVPALRALLSANGK